MTTPSTLQHEEIESAERETLWCMYDFLYAHGCVQVVSAFGRSVQAHVRSLAIPSLHTYGETLHGRRRVGVDHNEKTVCSLSVCLSLCGQREVLLGNLSVLVSDEEVIRAEREKERKDQERDRLLREKLALASVAKAENLKKEREIASSLSSSSSSSSNVKERESKESEKKDKDGESETVAVVPVRRKASPTGALLPPSLMQLPPL